jgi:hypothetical protein
LLPFIRREFAATTPKARTTTRKKTTNITRSNNREHAALAPNTALLSRIADVSGGRLLKRGEDVLAVRGAKRVPTPLALPLLTLALFLLPLDVANRRLSLWRSRETAQAAVEQVQQTIVQKQEERKESVRVAEQRAFTQSQTRIQERKARFKSLEGDDE